MSNLFNSYEKLNGRYKVKVQYPNGDMRESFFVYASRGSLQALFVHKIYRIIDEYARKQYEVEALQKNNIIIIRACTPWRKNSYGHFEREGEETKIWVERITD